MTRLLIDGGDIDDNGRWVMPLCCIDCHSEVSASLTAAMPLQMYDVELYCRECLEPLTPAFDQWSGRVRQ